MVFDVQLVKRIIFHWMTYYSFHQHVIGYYKYVWVAISNFSTQIIPWQFQGFWCTLNYNYLNQYFLPIINKFRLSSLTFLLKYRHRDVIWVEMLEMTTWSLTLWQCQGFWFEMNNWSFNQHVLGNSKFRAQLNIQVTLISSTRPRLKHLKMFFQ